MDAELVTAVLEGMVPIFEEHFNTCLLCSDESNGPRLRVASIFWVHVYGDRIFVKCNGYGIFVNQQPTFGTSVARFSLADPNCFDEVVLYIKKRLAEIDEEIIAKGIFNCGILEARKSLLKSLES